MGAEERACATPVAVLDKARSKEFLHICLNKATFSEDMISDVCDACEMNELNALMLGSGELSIVEAADKLFLMADEATEILFLCKRECLRIGVDYGDGETYAAGGYAEEDEGKCYVSFPQPS